MENIKFLQIQNGITNTEDNIMKSDISDESSDSNLETVSDGDANKGNIMAKIGEGTLNALTAIVSLFDCIP